MKPVDIKFTFSTNLNSDERSDGSNKVHSFCEELTNKFITKNPNIKIQFYFYDIEMYLDLISAKICVQNITDKDTLSNLIDDIKNGKFDTASN